jgi:hypothetical protein
MPASLNLTEHFINEALVRFLPESVPVIKLTIEEEYLVATVPVSVIGLKFNPSAAFRLVSFNWNVNDKVFVLELIKTSLLDAKPVLSYIKRFLPEFISIDGTFLIIDLNKIEKIKMSLDNVIIQSLILQKIGISKGNINLSFEFDSGGSDLKKSS